MNGSKPKGRRRGMKKYENKRTGRKKESLTKMNGKRKNGEEN